MKFLVTWSLQTIHQKEATARFLATGGPPPSGVAMLGRWHGPAGGFCLAETSDAKALYEWVRAWCDLLEFTVTPVVDDAEAAEVMKKVAS